MNFKLEFMRNYIMLDAPKQIRIWEDRENHAEIFRQHFTSQDFSFLTATVYLMPSAET
jgi:hypothetical protein